LNKKFRTHSLQLHLNDHRPHEHFQWNATRKLCFPCPVCAHVSTALFGLANTSQGDSMAAEQVAAAAQVSTSNTGCFCYRINCHGIPDGQGVTYARRRQRLTYQPSPANQGSANGAVLFALVIVLALSPRTIV